MDVYSYGVVLLELISGRHGMQLSEDAEPIGISMVHWIWDMVEAGKVLTIADPTLDHRFYNEDFIRMVEIGLWCTQSHPHMRPSMNQVNDLSLPNLQKLQRFSVFSTCNSNSIVGGLHTLMKHISSLSGLSHRFLNSPMNIVPNLNSSTKATTN